MGVIWMRLWIGTEFFLALRSSKNDSTRPLELLYLQLEFSLPYVAEKND